MASTVTHSFVSAKSDGADNTVVQPGDWNADHVLPAWASGSASMGSYGGNASLGNGSLSHRYIQIGKLVVVEFHLVGGSTTTWGTGGGYINNLLPVTQAATLSSLIIFAGDMDGSNGVRLIGVKPVGGGVFELYMGTGSGLTGSYTNITLSISFTYEAA
jgi:hypothetical protein